MRYNKGIYQERSLPMYPLIRRYLRRVDVVYLLLCAACSAISIAVLLSIGQTQLGSNNKASVQLIASLLGLMLAVVFSTADYHALARAWPLHGVVAWGLVLLCVNSSDKLKSWQKTVIILLVCVITFPSDWSCIASMAILFIGSYRGNFRKQMLWMMFWTLLYALVYFFFIDRVYALVQLGTCLTIPLLRLYNGERGSWKGMGKLFYAYYPAHLAACGILRIVLWGVGFVTAAGNI